MTRRLHCTCLMSLAPFAGCVYTPKESVVYESAAVGTSRGAALRVAEADRAAVLTRFGPPGYRTDHDRAFGYLFAPEIGNWRGLLLGPCSTPYIGSSVQSELDDLWLEFDDGGILRRYEKRLVARCDGRSDRAWRQFTKSVPDTWTRRKAALPPPAATR